MNDEKNIDIWFHEKFDTMRDECGFGRGVKGAFQSGARDRLNGCNKNTFTRMDCKIAWMLGWKLMDQSIREGIKFECPECKQHWKPHESR